MLNIFCFDTETERFREGCMAPPLVCITWQRPGAEAHIHHHSEALPYLMAGLKADVIVGQNIAYDMAVVCARFPELIPLVFQAYEDGRVTDTMIRAQLIDIAGGVYRSRRYNLESLAMHYAGMKLQKDAWRTSYGLFKDVPLSGWVEHAKTVQEAFQAERTALTLDMVEGRIAKDHGPSVDRLKALTESIEADPYQVVKYPLDDARATLAVYLAQEQHARYLDNQYEQAYAAFALHLSSCWGLRTDVAGVEKVRDRVLAQLAEIEGRMIEVGFIRPNGTKDTKAVQAYMVKACEAADIEVPRTKTGQVQVDGAACEATEDFLLLDYAKVNTAKKVLANDLEALAKAAYVPCHTRYGLAESGRTTSSGPNIQNWNGKVEGIREAFVAREGHVFFECDYPQLELYTLAECCMAWFGQSELAKVLLANKDPHLVVAAQVGGITYDEALERHKAKDPALKKWRAYAKIANFGFPGGLSVKSAIEYAKRSMSLKDFNALGFGIEQAQDLKSNWERAYPEMREYFNRVRKLCANDRNRAEAVTLYTNRTRGNASFCATCNNGFQALGSDCAKRAACIIARAQYVQGGKHPALFGTRTVAFVHDEFIGEAPVQVAAEAAEALADAMLEGANTYLKHVPMARERFEPVLMRRWAKAASTVRDTAGRLMVWETKEAK